MDELEKDGMVSQIIKEWMSHYPPAAETDMFKLLLTSYEIAELLNDFCPVEAGAVTRELLASGYKLTRTSEGNIKWMIKKTNNNE